MFECITIQKQEDRGMKRSALNQLHTLLFFVIISGITQPQHIFLKNYLREIYHNYEKTDEQIEDEKLLQELWHVADDFYKKIITLTALYFSGALITTDQLQTQIMYELGKHVLYLGQIFALYLPKLLYNPHISWRIKAKRCTYIGSFLILITIWMKKTYKPDVSKNGSPQIMQPENTYNASPEQSSSHSSSRPRPKLS